MSKWIKIDEALPPLQTRVLVWCYGRICFGLMESIDGKNGFPEFYICDSVYSFDPILSETTEHDKLTKGAISAWMPLPAPPIIQKQSGLDDTDLWGSGMSSRVIWPLWRFGYKSMGDLNGLSAKYLNKFVRGCGPKAVAEIKAALQNMGGDLKD